MEGFNLFRVNCLLNDTKSATFNSIILSIIHEFFYEKQNVSKPLTDIYKHIKDYLKISVELDFLTQLVQKSQQFEVEPIDKDLLIKIVPEEFQKIENAITTNSIGTYIKIFLYEYGYDIDYREPIEELLYSAVFENINSFSVDNLKTILPKLDKDFSKKEIEIFNLFLDYDNEEKNKAIYNIFSRAVEFAIITSGKGIKEINFDFFKNKTFVLDTNILFRLLGIGGEQILDSTFDLLNKCKELGIKFEYTGKTHTELLNKLEQIINFLNSARGKSIELLGELTELSSNLLNDDFIIHYAKLRKESKVLNPEHYKRKIYGDYQDVLKKLGVSISKQNDINPKDLAKYAKFLFTEKVQMKVRYARGAAEVDAYNL